MSRIVLRTLHLMRRLLGQFGGIHQWAGCWYAARVDELLEHQCGWRLAGTGGGRRVAP